MNTKRSLFERLSGSSGSDAFETFDDDLSVIPSSSHDSHVHEAAPRSARIEDDSPASAGQLPVDVHQTANEIIIRAFVAGVRPDELNISISRDMVEIGGARTEREQVATPDYFIRELFWGSFSRTIMLPQEVDVENSSASAKDGLLTILLPKLDKARQTKLKVKIG